MVHFLMLSSVILLQPGLDPLFASTADDAAREGTIATIARAARDRWQR